MQLTATGGAAVSGSTSYDSASTTATFTPTAALAASTGYTMTVSGASDVFGNVMSPFSWSFTTGQTITQLWNGSVTQSGAQVTVANASYNAAITTGGTAAFGFNGASTGSNPAPAAFTLNGVVSCVLGALGVIDLLT